MSDHDDDPLLGLLTDIAEGVAVLVARVDAMDAKIAAQHDLVTEALATIAEIATRTYYTSKPANPLPDDVINASVMDAMIERWPKDAQVTFPPPEFEALNGVATLKTAEIEALLRSLAVVEQNTTNAFRVRRARALAMFGQEMDKRAKAHRQSLEREDRGRGR